MAFHIVVKQMGWKGKKLGHEEIFPSYMKDELLQAEKDGLIAIIANVDVKKITKEFLKDEDDENNKNKE